MTAHPDLTSETEFLPINKFKLHYFQRGSGRPVVLIHGGGTWLYSFRHNFIPLARKYSVYAFDMPGHGYTQVRPTHKRYDLDAVCETLCEFMDAMQLHKAHLIGHSWGGGWALHFADQFPDRVDKLILMDSSGMHRYEQLPWELMKYRFLEKFLLKFLSEKTIRKGLEAGFYDKTLVDEEMIRNIYAPMRNPDNLKAQLSYSRNINWKQTKAVLPLIRSQVLIIWGKNDSYINVKYGRRMQVQIPNAQLKIIDRCGHSPHEEHPEQVNSLITDFLSEKSSTVPLTADWQP